MKAFYYENNGYNGILIANEDGKWISYDEIIDGIQITRENSRRRVQGRLCKSTAYAVWCISDRDQEIIKKPGIKPGFL